MHIPDAFLPLPQGLIYWVIALIFIALSLRWAKKEMGEEEIPLVAVLAAGIFAIQTMNMALPISIVPGGVSGHVVGAALAAIVLGSPFAAIFILTLVLLLQAIFFGDGGITSMGANIINMGIIGGFLGFYSYRSLNSVFGSRFVAAFSAGWVSLFIPAIACAFELAVAGIFPLTIGLITMGTYHAFIGVIEGGATAFALSLITLARPDLFNRTHFAVSSKKRDILIMMGILCALAVAIAAPFVASSYPDALEATFFRIYGANSIQKLPTDENRTLTAEKSVLPTTGNAFSWSAPFSDYKIPGLDKPGEILAIVIGIIVILLVGFGVAWLATRAR